MHKLESFDFLESLKLLAAILFPFSPAARQGKTWLAAATWRPRPDFPCQGSGPGFRAQAQGLGSSRDVLGSGTGLNPQGKAVQAEIQLRGLTIDRTRLGKPPPVENAPRLGQFCGAVDLVYLGS